ncbi:MAG: DUF2892 domain-containing protein [Gammaproteobacteria bacterium]
MDLETRKIAVFQNLGAVDRVIRVVLGTVLLGGAIINMQTIGAITAWHALAGLVSVYPFLTGILGWDPFYSMFGARSCNIDGGRNACGSFPYEVDAAAGHNPVPDTDVDSTLTGSHHETNKKAA